MLDLIVTCPFCGRESILTVAEADFEAWQAGAFVQDAFPYLTAGEREMLISGTCPTCWDEMFVEMFRGDDPELLEDHELEYEYDDEMLECGFDPYEGCYTFDC